MADKIYDDQNGDLSTKRIKELEGLDNKEDSNSTTGSNSGSEGNYSFYNNGRSNSSSESSKNATNPKDKSDNTSSNDSNSFYKPSKGKSQNGVVGTVKSKKKLWLLLGGGGGGLLVLLAVAFVFISSLLIPNLGQNILAYQFSRVNRSFSEDNLELTSEKVAIDSMEDPTQAAEVEDDFNDTATDGLLTKLNSYTPGGVVKNLQTDGELSYNTEPSKLLGKPVLKSITVGDQTLALNNDTLASKFSSTIHPIQSFQNQVEAASQLSEGLDNAMRDQTGIIIRGVVENRIRQELGISLSAWLVSKFKGDTPTEALEEEDREAQQAIDPSTDEVSGSVVEAVQQADSDGEAQLQKDISTPAGLQAIEQNDGVDKNVENVETADLLQNALGGIASKLSFVYTIALPACIIYDGSLSSPNAAPTIDTQDDELQRSFYYVESAADQQKYGATNAQAVGALNTKLGDVSQSIPEVRAGGGVVDTGSSYLSPQAGSGGQYSIASLLPGPLGSIMNEFGGTVCPILTNSDVIDATIIANLALIIASSIPSGGTAGEGEAAGEAGVETAVDSGISGFANSIAEKLTSNVVSGTILRSTGKISEMFTKKELVKVTALTGITVLAKMAVLAKTHETYNGLSQGTDFANQADAGGNLNANEVERQEFYGAPLSNSQVAYNNYSDQQYIAEQNKSKSIFDRYLAIDNSESLVSKVAFGIMGDLNKSFISKSLADIFTSMNPINIGEHFYDLVSNSTKVAAAANTIDNNDYGIVQWGLTSQEENLINPNTGNPSYQPLENQKILHDSGEEDYIQAVYGNCFSSNETMGDLLTTPPPSSFTSGTTGAVYSNPDPGQPAYIIRNSSADVTGGLCSDQYLGLNSADPHAADGSYGNDLIFRWRLAQSYNSTLQQLTDIQNASSS